MKKVSLFSLSALSLTLLLSAGGCNDDYYDSSYDNDAYEESDCYEYRGTTRVYIPCEEETPGVGSDADTEPCYEYRGTTLVQVPCEQDTTIVGDVLFMENDFYQTEKQEGSAQEVTQLKDLKYYTKTDGFVNDAA